MDGVRVAHRLKGYPWAMTGFDENNHDSRILKEHHEYPSKDGRSRIKAVFWLDGRFKQGDVPRAIIQIVHGMGEHVGRYERFARYLAGLGFIVCGNDHIGHGRTAQSPDEFGELPGRHPVDYMVDDVHALRQAIQSDIVNYFPADPTLPYVMFGHSMGSLILRCYLPKYGEGLTGAIICGTTMPNRLMSGAGVLLSKALIALKGPRVKSNFLHQMAYGVYSKKIPNARTKFDWISSDPKEVDAFIADEATGFKFSGAVYLALTEGAFDSAQAATFRGIPKELPILLISGDEDPVGGNGRQVEKVGNKMRAPVWRA